MSKLKGILCKVIFAVTFLLSCMTMNSDNLPGYMGNNGTPFIFFRLALILFFVFIAALINRKNDKFISIFAPASACIITVLLIFDYYVTNISGSQFFLRIWWIVSVFAAQLSLFSAVTISKPENYGRFYRNFWYGFSPLYIFTLVICFLRNPFNGVRTVNTVPFNGTFLMLKALINNPSVSFEAPMIFFGNLLIFLPLPFILFSFFKKSKAVNIAAIGFLVPIFIEGYQYIFSCGDVDVDDLILNWFGFFTGFIIQRIINKKQLTLQ